MPGGVYTVAYTSTFFNEVYATSIANVDQLLTVTLEGCCGVVLVPPTIPESPISYDVTD